jgi:WD40 repeat protein
VAFNWYGTHLATCSSDQNVKVWTLDAESNAWTCSASWKSHSGAVWKVTWAHPEFGQVSASRDLSDCDVANDFQVLATCSFDRTASVWEEMPGNQKPGGVQGGDTASGQSHWVKKTSLVDSRTSVTDVKFAPKHLGLLLATCSADGTVRIYEAPDVMNLSQVGGGLQL